LNLANVGDGKVVLLAGGGRCFTDISARFVGSEKNLEEIIASEYDKKLVQNILSSGHLAATEFDTFVFGIEGYARVTEIQLVRKRLASYLIKSGRSNKQGKRSFDMVLPKNIQSHATVIEKFPADQIYINDEPLDWWFFHHTGIELATVNLNLTTLDILGFIETWYNDGVFLGLPEEDLRYLKPQATEFKAIIAMNCHSLIDWTGIRCCKLAQKEINDLAWKMLRAAREVQPDLLATAGPNCLQLGYCPENKRQHPDCRGKIITKQEALPLLRGYKTKKEEITT
jgi:thymidylate synthase (FAD)